MASSLVIRELTPATAVKPSSVRVATKEAGITAAIARLASGRQAG